MKKALKVIAVFGSALYALLLVYVLFINLRRHFGAELSLSDYIRYSSNLVPFKSISLYVEALFNGSMNIGTPIRNLFGNLLMFLPMGLYLPYFFRGLCRFGRFVICMAVILITVEVAQLLLRVGSFDIDDVILNITGALAGLAIYKVIEKAITRKAAGASQAALSE